MVEDCTPVTTTIKEQHSPLPYHYLEDKNREGHIIDISYRRRNSYLLEGIDHMILFIMYVIDIPLTTQGSQLTAEKNRVLLVEDEPDVVYLVKRGLERNGFEVDSYTDPMLALQNFKGGVYSLLLLDIKMPRKTVLNFLV
jgi:hypothetical protein